MKIAILQCGEVSKESESQAGCNSEMIKAMFDVTEGFFEFESFDCQDGCYPDDIDDYDFYITSGSKAGVYEDKVWIQRLIKFVRQLDNKKKKLIGICFGHQIMAMACDGMVEKSENGWGVGVAVNRVVSNPEWMSEKRAALNLPVSHQDQIITVPEDAQIIAESDFCPFFMVQWNDHFLSTQGHPEWNREYSEIILARSKGTIPNQLFQSALSSLHIKSDNTLFKRWIMDFVRS